MRALQEQLWPAAREHETEEPGGLEQIAAIDWAFSGSTKRRYTHDLHPWPAKFIPDIPAAAVRAFTNPGDTILDPFCGCGTAAVEARASGRAVIAVDVNPLATLITAGKCEVPDAGARASIRRWADSRAWDDAPPAAFPSIPNFDYWFAPDIAAQLAALLGGIEAFGDQTEFLRTVFSSIVVRASHQESETRYRRVERQISAEDVVELFVRRLTNGLAMAAELDEILAAEAGRSYITADARDLAEVLDAGVAKLAVFSPPYPNAFDYHLYHRFRMFWLGMDPRLVKHQEIGAHLRYEPKENWAADMTRVFAGIRHALAEDGHVLCVVGDGVVRGEIVPSADLLWDIGKTVGLTPTWRTTRSLASHRRAFNLADTRLRKEHVLVFSG